MDGLILAQGQGLLSGIIIQNEGLITAAAQKQVLTDLLYLVYLPRSFFLIVIMDLVDHFQGEIALCGVINHPLWFLVLPEHDLPVLSPYQDIIVHH